MQAWEDFLTAQEDEIGKETVGKWLRSLKILQFDACNLYLEAQDSFQVIWFEEHIQGKVRTQLVNNNNHPIKVHLQVADPATTSSKKKKVKKSWQPPPLKLEPDPLFSSATFEQFVVGESNQVIYKVLSDLSTVQSAFNPIYIYGAAGSGKTHLLMAIAHLLKQKNLHVFFVRAETFTEHVVSAIRGGAMQEFRNTYRNADALLIDDVHLFARRNATQEELFHTFNTLHTTGKQIILTASCSPGYLQDIEPRLVSRFEWGITLPLEKLSATELKQVLKNRCQAIPFPLEEETIEFLIKTFHANAKSLHRALEALILRSSGDTRIATVETLLADLIAEENQNALSAEKIIRAVADFYSIREADILGKAQSHDCALPRQIAMHLCRGELKLPFLKIGKIFSRDHSTVMSSIKQIQNKIEAQDKEISSAVFDILRRLE
jgi:chromosomal replication initiator protein